MDIPSPPDESAKHFALARLRESGFRITGPRQALLDVLLEATLPLKIEELHHRMGNAHCDLATIYRCLATFQELGIVRRCYLHDGTSLFEINHPDRHHSHHIICKVCDKIRPFDVCVAEGLEPLVRKLGYTDVSHLMEFFGVCEECQENQPDGTLRTEQEDAGKASISSSIS